MFDSHAFFKKRFSAHLKETNRYLKYIFNGHLAFAMLFFIAAAAYYYQQWLAGLPANFPTAWIIGITLGLLVSYSPARTLLQEPDLIFLIAAEHKMGAYFRNSLIYSFVIQLYVILLIVAAFGPLYFASYPDRSGSLYLITIAVVLIFKVWNLLANWWMLKVRDPGIRRIDTLARVLLNCAVFYFFVNGNMIPAAVATVLFIVVFLYDLSVSRKQAGIVWDLLVEKDQNRMQFFYRIANMFTDVPHLKNRVKRRQWLVSVVDRVPFLQKFTFDYLYRITFVRSGDYLGMYLRLIIIGGIVIYFVPNSWIRIIFALLFLYLSSFQMMTLYQHHRTVIWLDLYPVPIQRRQQAVLKWLYLLTFVQTFIYAVLFLVLDDYLGFVLTIAGGSIFNYLFITGYVKQKLT
ncbi:ABC transporter permease [Virgibacillus dakarensis]|uniref:ABC transporter permease n=1 Tax=Lentibacillus populi TaxID=1827502 RepID=A0A9W5TZK3_9BACI|nr:MULTISPECIES: ABC transporter permease [Bacillaceae]MBT2215334.1 ABC transporter permease [Virgibacillus dakarensis]MTW85498.1 ABC transporter permease [Virgibacillus dakarensis]GGB51638.1 ABC transporter permease [Lentibacillus populi]